MLTEIAVLFAGRTFGGTTDVSRFDLVRSEESVTSFTFAYGIADALDAFRSVGSRSVGGGIHIMIPHTLFSEERVDIEGIGDEGFVPEQSPRIPFVCKRDIFCLYTGDASDRLDGTWFHNRCKNDLFLEIQRGNYIRGNVVPL